MRDHCKLGFWFVCFILRAFFCTSCARPNFAAETAFEKSLFQKTQRSNARGERTFSEPVLVGSKRRDHEESSTTLVLCQPGSFLSASCS